MLWNFESWRYKDKQPAACMCILSRVQTAGYFMQTLLKAVEETELPQMQCMEADEYDTKECGSEGHPGREEGNTEKCTGTKQERQTEKVWQKRQQNVFADILYGLTAQSNETGDIPQVFVQQYSQGILGLCIGLSKGKRQIGL